ncbi:hypothetical protein FRC20_008627, partial [Serendipita sp. 405]
MICPGILPHGTSSAELTLVLLALNHHQKAKQAITALEIRVWARGLLQNLPKRHENGKDTWTKSSGASQHLLKPNNTVTYLRVPLTVSVVSMSFLHPNPHSVGHDTSNQPLFTPLEALSVPERQQIDTSESRSSSPSRRKRPEPLTPLTMGSPGANEPNRHHSDRVGAASVALSGRETPDYSDSEDLHDALGQLSLDDASQIRYHGKASGLHLLGQTERVDRRAEGGIWRFPPARVWPPLERPIEKARALFASDFGVQLPTIEQQRHLLDTFFTYINPSLPLFDRESFMRAWSLGIDESSESPPVPTFIPTRLPLPLML